ncbi:hypothetical protein [Mesorhizobium sp. IMUNJ 23232]|uniref:hypothetical protein n=1 Tax=Mesorhizobium sp. IMUNJ 23232 TaxID=3376064 RepID=UPI0037B0757B
MKSLLDNYLPLKVTAHLIGWGESTLRRKLRLAACGKIPKGDVPPWVRYNGQYFFSLEEVLRWFRRKIEQGV